ncbi:hypothetical protein [Arthrobacter sp. OAP107]|uniref:hypothetical protein n=1 Tax=Arthrobacter sp. OAP107 TaxID=3156445 RepID=UPI00339A8666
MWDRSATWGDLRKFHESRKGQPGVSSLDWIALGTVVDEGQPDSAPLFPKAAAEDKGEGQTDG